MSAFGRFPKWVLPRLSGKFSATAALVELVCLMDSKDNTVRVSHQRLADRMGCSINTVVRSIEVLVTVGVLRRERTLYSSNKYVVNKEEPPMTDWEEWATLGEDPKDKEEEVAIKGRIPRLLHYFRTEVERLTPMSIQSQVNTKALSRHFKEMLDQHGIKDWEIKKMISLFAFDLERGAKHLNDTPAWQAFLADRQKLLTRTRKATEDVVYISEPTQDG